MATLRSLPVLDRLLFGAILFLTVTLLTLTDAVRRLDYVLYDSFLSLMSKPVQPDLAIVAIDEISLAELGHWPWPRDLHARLIERLRQVQARALVFDILFTEPDRTQPQRDELLAAAMQAHAHVLLPLHIDRRSGGAPLSEILPLPAFAGAAAQLGHAHVELEQDGIARGLFLHQGVGNAHWPALSLALMTHLDPARATAYQASPSRSGNAWFNVREDFRLIPFAGPTGTIPTYSYSDVLFERLPPDSLRNKIVFVGATAAGLGDFLPTPFSGLASPMPGVEVHANAYNALASGQLIQTVPVAWQLALSLVVLLLPVLLFPRLAPERNLPLNLLLLLAAPFSAYLLLAQANLWLGPAPLMATLLMAYPVWSWRRLARLNRFLSQELQRLSREPTLTGSDGTLGIEDWFARLVTLLEPSEQALYHNNAYIAGNAPTLQPPVGLPVAQWTRRDGFWWLLWGADTKQRYLAALRWEPNSASDALARALINLMPTYLADDATAPRRRTEVIERRIQQVQTAISALRTMRQFISDSFESMPDGILVTDRLGDALFVNAHCQEWFPRAADGSHPPDLLSWLKPYPPLGRLSWPQLIREVLVFGRQVSVGMRLPDRELLVQMVPFAATDSHDSGLIASFSDISHVREEQRRRLETVDFVSHDLRSPLVSQLALFEQMLEGGLSDQAELLQRAKLYTQKSLELADQFLQLTRVEAAEEIRFYDCDLLAVLENAVDQVQDQALEKQITVEIAETSEEAWMLGNAELLERVVVNLLTNAVKYSPASTRVTASVCRENDWICLEVRDQGCGIAANAVPNIFERFRQTPSLDKQRVTSAGLGLRFVKIVVERHLGQIMVDSTPGQGTRFRILFPVTEGATPP